MTATLVFRISDVRIEVLCDVPVAMRALGAVWGRACEGPLPIARSETFRVVGGERDGWDVVHGDRKAGHANVDEDIASVVEGAIYECMPAWHAPPRVLLHSACVLWEGRPILFVGESGAGKSSLARAAMRRGASYLTDDLVVTDGARVWGVPRAIQFDPIPADEPPPAWLGAVDLESYRLRLPGNRPGRLPLAAVPAERSSFASHDVRSALLVTPKRGDTTRLERLPHLAGLVALHAGAIGRLDTNLGGLVGPGRVFRLEWSTPEAGVELVLDACGARAG